MLAYFSKQKIGFTMIELLIVMGVLAILIGLIYSVTTALPESARDNQAKTEVRAIALALKAYKADNGKWPNQTQDATDTVYFANNYLVVRELMGDNPRRKVYLEVPTNRLDPDGNYFDPWGMPYVICMDEDGNNNLEIYKFSNQGFRKRAYAEPGESMWQMKSNSLSSYVGAIDMTNYFLLKNVTADAGSFKNSGDSIQIVSWREK